MEKENTYYCVVEYTQERQCNIVSVDKTEEEAIVNRIKWTSDSDGSNQYIVASMPGDILNPVLSSQ